MKVYVVAINQKEADSIAVKYGHAHAYEAAEHLKEVKAPPTDPYYASKYHIYTSLVDRKEWEKYL